MSFPPGITPGRSAGSLDSAGRRWAELRDAIYYPSLQYQCSQLSNGVLCDTSVDPPLSVDREGGYLNRKSLLHTKYVLFVAPVGITSIEYAVIATLVTSVVVAVICTFAGLGPEGLRRCRAFCP